MSTAPYYELRDDMLIAGRWVLGEARAPGIDWFDPGQFVEGRPASVDLPLTFNVLHPGQALDLSLGHMSVPIANRRAANVLAAVCGPQVQLIEVSIQGHPGPFFIANATQTADCVDEQRSEGVRRWTAEDGRPERIGEYYTFDHFRIDPGRTQGLDFFRVARYTVALIVSDRLKRAMEEAKLLGPKFDLVTPT